MTESQTSGHVTAIDTVVLTCDQVPASTHSAGFGADFVKDRAWFLSGVYVQSLTEGGRACPTCCFE